MASKPVPATFAALTVDGTANGYITVADNTGFYVGCTAYLRSDLVDSQECRIMKLSGDTQIALQFMSDGDPSYGQSDCSAYLVVDNAKIFMPAQIAVAEIVSTVVSGSGTTEIPDYGGADNVIYQRNTGSDTTGTGSLATPYATLQKCLDSMPLDWYDGRFIIDLDPDYVEAASLITVPGFRTDTVEYDGVLLRAPLHIRSVPETLYTIDAGGTQSSIDLGPLTTNLDAIVTATGVNWGASGDNVQIELVPDGVGTVSFTEAGNVVTVHYVDGVTTAGELAGYPAGITLVSINVYDNFASVLSDPGDSLAPTNLAGGVDPAGAIKLASVQASTDFPGMTDITLSGVAFGVNELTNTYLYDGNIILLTMGAISNNLDATSFRMVSANVPVPGFGYTTIEIRSIPADIPARIDFDAPECAVSLSGLKLSNAAFRANNCYLYADNCSFAGVNLVESGFTVNNCLFSESSFYAFGSSFALNYSYLSSPNFNMGSSGRAPNPDADAMNVINNCALQEDSGFSFNSLGGRYLLKLVGSSFLTEGGPGLMISGPGQINIESGCRINRELDEGISSAIELVGPEATLLLKNAITQADNWGHAGIHMNYGARCFLTEGLADILYFSNLTGTGGDIGISGTLFGVPDSYVSWQNIKDNHGNFDLDSDTAVILVDQFL